MKITNLLPLACLAPLSLAGTPCSMTKNPGVLNAIGKFCQNQGIVVPSSYAGKGMGGGYNGESVQITGSCSPPQWVPQEYCVSQFKMMCSNGRRERKFGRNGCQTWKINYGTERKAEGGGAKMGAQPAPGKPKGKPESVTVNL
ncbi:hypothetical protein PRZ48_005129 [Zasmidium cellare]|uniref:Uncharacterized protein n=1 Tax=Zasmidium cellare TaxID=395010 RepID=A0ABR0ESP7_ZASCE|nr:hypothetical protein PRZ48_005129 [Zasmidium cellare]